MSTRRRRPARRASRARVPRLQLLPEERAGRGRTGAIPVPPPRRAPAPQTFPPTRRSRSRGRGTSRSPDGSTMLAALDLADPAAIVDTAARKVALRQPAATPTAPRSRRDGKPASFERDRRHGTVIDLAAARRRRTSRSAPPSHPEGIAIDPKVDARLRSGHQPGPGRGDRHEEDEVERTLSVERPRASARRPSGSVTADGCRLLVADSGEDAIAVFALPTAATTSAARSKERSGAPRGAQGRERPRRITAEAEDRSTARSSRPSHSQLLGRVPVASYPAAVDGNAEAPGARLDRRQGPRRRAEPERPEPATRRRHRRPHQHVPVPAVDRRRHVGHRRLPHRRELRAS